MQTRCLCFMIFAVCFCFLGTFFGGAVLSTCSAADVMGEEEVILSALELMEAEINLSDYRRAPIEIMNTYRLLLENTPHLYHVAPSVSYTYDNQGYLLSLYPKYTMSSDEYMSSKAVWTEYLQKITKEIDMTSSEADKALWIHDHLATHYSYSPAGEENYDAFSLLRDGHGVCQAFSLMYMAIGHALGLEIDMVTSIAMDHAWNHVRIGDTYYHVDVTRDLPAEGETPSHERFLLCDQAIKAYGYFAYTCKAAHVCDSHAYDALSSTNGHRGILADVTESLYVAPYQLTLLTEGALCLMDLRGDTVPDMRRTDNIDLDGDGQLSLADILLPVVQNVTADKKAVVNALRYRLLAETLSLVDRT